MNAWVLIPDLDRWIEDEDDLVATIAEICKVEAIYPVDSLVLTPDAEFVDGFWVQDYMGMARYPGYDFPRPMSKFAGQRYCYLAFLKEALANS